MQQQQQRLRGLERVVQVDVEGYKKMGEDLGGEMRIKILKVCLVRWWQWADCCGDRLSSWMVEQLRWTTRSGRGIWCNNGPAMHPAL